MLKQLNIQNFAIIDKMSVDFHDGLTIITGQTGAGKSIVIDAIEQLMGSRASSSMIGINNDYAYIEGVFEKTNDLILFLNENNIEIDEDYLIISKRIKADGKSQVKLNNRIVSNDTIKTITALMVEIHSQHATISLNDTKNQQDIVDSYFSKSELDIYSKYKIDYEKYVSLLKKKDNILSKTIDPELLSFYQDQLLEIEKLLIDEAEAEKLIEEERYYQSFEKINEHLAQSYNYLENEISLDNIKQAELSLDKLSDIDNTYEVLSNRLNSIYYDIIDIKEEIKDKKNSLFFDEDQYLIIKDKLFNYNKLMKKYGYSHQQIEEKISELKDKIDFIENSDKLLKDLDEQITKQYSSLYKQAQILDSFRLKYISKIEKKVKEELSDLYLNNAKFKIDLEKVDISKNGISKINFLFSANKGISLRPIQNVASGGELSRFILALKSISLNNEKLYIFDEIDTGVSGEVANAIGMKFKEIAKNYNLISITHLPQVACYATNHLYIEKDMSKHVTTSNCYYLDSEQRILELAKMLSGKNISDAAIMQAKELIANANKI